MKKVLFIAYYFPPHGGAGVQRAVKFVKYLPIHGWSPVVLTCAEGDGSAKVIDKTFYNDIPENIEVFRTPHNSQRHSDIKTRLYKKALGRNLHNEQWAKQVEILGAKILKEQRIDLIFVTMSPFQCAASAAALSKKFEVPWIADLRDPWALDETRMYASSVHRFFDVCKMRRDLFSADMVIMNTPEARRCVTEKFGWHGKNIRSLTNGFDREDFVHKKAYTRNEKFTIVHTGGLHTKTGLEIMQKKGLYRLLGKMDNRVDILPRSHFYLIKSMEQLVRERPDIIREIRIVLAGKANEIDLKIAHESKITSCIEFRNYVTHDESIELLLGADLLFLPMHDLPDSKRATIVPGKTYEYMAAGKPILAAVPNGDAKDYLTQCGTAFMCEPKSVAKMRGIIESVYESWKDGCENYPKKGSYVDSFSRECLTNKLSVFFDELVKDKQGIGIPAEVG